TCSTLEQEYQLRGQSTAPLRQNSPGRWTPGAESAQRPLQRRAGLPSVGPAQGTTVGPRDGRARSGAVRSAQGTSAQGTAGSLKGRSGPPRGRPGRAGDGRSAQVTL